MFDGDDITGIRPYRFARLGIVMAPEGRSVFATLTVEENLELTFRRSRGRGGVRDALDHAYALFPRLGERRKQIAGTLSGGEQRMLSLSRVLVERPRLLIADELSLGLAPIIVDEVYRTLERIRDSGTTLLLVEQHVHHALEIADDAVVLIKGEVSVACPVPELGDIQTRLFGSRLSGPAELGAEQRCVHDACERVDHVVARHVDLSRQHVVVQALDHRDERERRDDWIESGWSDLGDAMRQDPRELGEYVGSEPSELAAADLGFGPCPDDRAVVLVQVRELLDPVAERVPAEVARTQRLERFRELASLVGDLARQRAEQGFLVREVEVEGAVRSSRQLHDVVDARGVVALGRERLDAGVQQAVARRLAAGAQFAGRRDGRTASRSGHRARVR